MEINHESDPLYAHSGCLDPDPDVFKCTDCLNILPIEEESEDCGTCHECLALQNIMEKVNCRRKKIEMKEMIMAQFDDFVENVIKPLYEATDFESMKIIKS